MKLKQFKLDEFYAVEVNGETVGSIKRSVAKSGAKNERLYVTIYTDWSDGCKSVLSALGDVTIDHRERKDSTGTKVWRMINKRDDTDAQKLQDFEDAGFDPRKLDRKTGVYRPTKKV